MDLWKIVDREQHIRVMSLWSEKNGSQLTFPLLLLFIIINIIIITIIIIVITSTTSCPILTPWI